MTKKQMQERIDALEGQLKLQADTIRVLLQSFPIQFTPFTGPISIPVPTNIPSVPAWPPYTPYIGDPPSYPNGPNWGGTKLGGTVRLNDGAASNIQSGRSDVLCINSSLSGGSSTGVVEGKPPCHSPS